MNEFEKKEYTLPVINFEFKNVLTVDGQILDIDDLAPAMLATYLKVGKKSIEDRLGILTNLRNTRDKFDPHPSILIGRLTSSDTEDEVFTFEGLKNLSAGLYDRESFKKRYKGFWDVIQRSDFIPEIHRDVLPNYPELEGTWLGLSQNS